MRHYVDGVSDVAVVSCCVDSVSGSLRVLAVASTSR